MDEFSKINNFIDMKSSYSPLLPTQKEFSKKSTISSIFTLVQRDMMTISNFKINQVKTSILLKLKWFLLKEWAKTEPCSYSTTLYNSILFWIIKNISYTFNPRGKKNLNEQKWGYMIESLMSLWSNALKKSTHTIWKVNQVRI